MYGKRPVPGTMQFAEKRTQGFSRVLFSDAFGVEAGPLPCPAPG